MLNCVYYYVGRDELKLYLCEDFTGIITDWLHGEVKLEKTLAVKYVRDIIKGSLTGIITTE